MKKTLLDEIEESRRRMHEIIDRAMDAFLLQMQGIDAEVPDDRTRFLSTDSAALKGEKPASLSFPDGRTKQTYTWRKLVSAVLEDCGSIPECRDRLMAVKNIVAGRKRVVLSDNPSEMNVPLKIADGLYFEGFFDTEFLFKQLRYVLDLAGYDYSGITFQLRERKQEQIEEQESIGEPEEENSGPTMSM